MTYDIKYFDHISVVFIAVDCDLCILRDHSDVYELFLVHPVCITIPGVIKTRSIELNSIEFN